MIILTSSARLSTPWRVKAVIASSPGPEDGEATVFRIHFDADFLQQVLVLAEHFGDTADGEDVADPSHGQAA